MLGDWYLYAQVNYTDSSPVVGNTVNISRGPVGSMVLKHAEKSYVLFINFSHLLTFTSLSANLYILKVKL